MRDVKNRPFGRRDKIGYLFGDFGCNMSFSLISSYLFLFVTQGLGILDEHWAIIVIVAKVFDAINDPIIGAIVDSRKPSKNGKYRPWIFWSSFAICLTTTLLFVDVRSFSYWGKFSYCLIMYMLWSIAYTAANVPYGSLNAALTDDLKERTNLSSIRSVGAGLAMLPIMVVVPNLIYKTTEGSDIKTLIPERFVWIALVCGIVGIVGFMLTYFLTHERQIIDKPKQKFSYKRTLKAFLHNKPIIALSLASFAQIVFILTYSVTAQLIMQVYFKEPKFFSVASVITMIPMVVLIPFMGKLSVKYGKKAISVWPNILSIVLLIIMLVVPFPKNMTGAWIFTIMLAFVMLGNGTFTLATWSMVADCVDQQEIDTGYREEGSVYATYSFLRKVAQGVGLALIPVCLKAVGYNAQSIENTTPEVADHMLKLSVGFLLIGFVLIFLVMLFMYNLSKKRVNENAVILKELHKELYVSDDSEEVNSEVSEKANLETAEESNNSEVAIEEVNTSENEADTLLQNDEIELDNNQKDEDNRTDNVEKESTLEEKKE